LFSSNSVMIRRKACASTYKLILCYPEAITTLSSYLADALEDVSPAVQIAAVTVMYELSRSNPRIFLLTVPKLFKLFKSDNNWLIIKLIKLMHEVVKVEPRMIKRLAKTYQNLLMTTKAKSVEIDLIREIIVNFRAQAELFTLAKERIVEYFSTDDNNLIYLGLSAIKCIMQNSNEDTSEFKNKIVQCFSKTDMTVRRAALHCIKSVVSKENVKVIIGDILQAIEELEFGTEKAPEQSTEDEGKEQSQSKEEDEKLDDEEETLADIHKKKVIRTFSDADKSYRDLQIKTVLTILIDDHYAILDGDFQWCIDVMIKLGVYKGKRIDKLLAETLRQLFIKLDDFNRKTGIEKVVKGFIDGISIKKEKSILNYSNEFIEALSFIISQNSFSVGAINSTKLLEFLRKHSGVYLPTLELTKLSLCELIFRLTLIELQNNINKNREPEIFFDRVKLFKTLVIEEDAPSLILDMRHSVYFNILSKMAEDLHKFTEMGNPAQLLEHVADLESFFKDEIIIGGSKQQATIEKPD
jgi:hypothetical protein